MDIMMSLPKMDYFNSHPHEEDDSIFANRWENFVISTHILTRRMTLQHTLDEDNPVYFNSHPHEEDDLSSEMSSSTLSISTHILTRRMTTRNSQIVRQEIFQLTSSRGG